MPDGAKIYNSANKLFELSLYHPVGVMIHGNAQLTGVPWETIIKEYRRELENKCFPELLDYCNDFLRFLNAHTNFFAQEEQDSYIYTLTENEYKNIRNSIHKEITTAFEKQSQISQSEAKQIIGKVIEQRNQDLERLKLLSCFSKNFDLEFMNKHKEEFRNLIGEVFDQLPLSLKNKNTLIKIAVNLFVRNHFSTIESGVVFAGFGDKEIFPKLYTYRIEGVLNNQLKYIMHDEKCIIGNSYPAIVPFAQEDMICSFIEGIDTRVELLSLISLNQVLENFSETILDEIKKSLQIEHEKLDNLISKSNNIRGQLIDKYREEMLRCRRELHIDPILTTVDFLPKDELGAMAQALVSLTVLKRRVTTDAETVGGPIDVAVILKGDGFIWIDRKHYFRAEQNQNFFYRKWHKHD